MNPIPEFEDKSLTVLRRKFLVGIPTFGLLGFVTSKMIATRYGFSRWPGRAMKIFGTLFTTGFGTMLIVHFNRAEIFRVGGSMLREMEELRRMEEGPFRDPNMREKWDQQMNSRKFNLLRPDTDIQKEYESGMDYSKIVGDSTRR